MSEFEKVERLFKASIEDLLSIPRKEWNQTFSGIHGGDLILIGNRLREVAVQAVRMAAYIDARGGERNFDTGHETAVNNQNELAAKVREVLGYQHPKEEIKF